MVFRGLSGLWGMVLWGNGLLLDGLGSGVTLNLYSSSGTD